MAFYTWAALLTQAWQESALLDNDKMKIALIQQHATEDLEANVARGLKHIDQAASQGAAMAVFAELAFTPKLSTISFLRLTIATQYIPFPFEEIPSGNPGILSIIISY